MDEDEKLKELEEELKSQKATRNYNFFRPVGQFIEHVDTVNFSMDKDGTFHFQNVGQVNGVPPATEVLAPVEEKSDEEVIPEGEELCKFIHPAIDNAKARKIHLVIKRLASTQDIQEICQYLNKMANDELILQPVNPTTAYEELTRMGMPKTAGYSYKTFQKYYRK